MNNRGLRLPGDRPTGPCLAFDLIEGAGPYCGHTQIESMVTAVRNIRDELAGLPARASGSWNINCPADMGDNGAAFVALPQIPPRNVTWAPKGQWVHLAKIAFERYFMRKMQGGSSETVYENYILKALGIERLSK